jgi:osmotically-inducible protein OsmY
MTDNELQLAVQEKLRWDDARHIAVTTKDGAVTLSGYVPTYYDRMRAVSDAEHVHGVKAVVAELEVAPSGSTLQRRFRSRGLPS